MAPEEPDFARVVLEYFRNPYICQFDMQMLSKRCDMNWLERLAQSINLVAHRWGQAGVTHEGVVDYVGGGGGGG
jgi:hypothetical protein